jgi:hydroxymethylbilane synthase
MRAALLSQIDHRERGEAVLAERAVALALGGTCHSPVGAYARVEGDEIVLACELLSEDGRDALSAMDRFAIGDLETPARLARDMLERAPAAIRRLFEPKD